MARLPNTSRREVTPDPKDGKRHVADFDEWTIIRRLKLGRCRVCQKHVYQSGLHHLVPRSQSGDDKPDNLVPLCGSGTMGCHGAVEARSKVACSLLRASLTPAERRYVIKRKSRWWLNDRYPLNAEDVQAIRGAEASA